MIDDISRSKTKNNEKSNEGFLLGNISRIVGFIFGFGNKVSN